MQKKVCINLLLISLLSISLVFAAGMHDSTLDSKSNPSDKISKGQTNNSQGKQDTERGSKGMNVKKEIRSGNYIGENGKQIRVQVQANNRVRLEVGGASCESSVPLRQQESNGKIKLSAKLSNGKEAEIKVMPDTASKRALERLRLRTCSEESGCKIELKEIKKSNGESEAAYELKTRRRSRFLGIFPATMEVKAQVSAETGELVKISKPWWSFLASEPEE